MRQACQFDLSVMAVLLLVISSCFSFQEILLYAREPLQSLSKREEVVVIMVYVYLGVAILSAFCRCLCKCLFAKVIQCVVR